MTRIIDARFRPSTEEFCAFFHNRALNGMLKDLIQRQPVVRDVNAEVAEIKAMGVEGAVIVGRDLESTFGVSVPNEHIAEVCDRHPDFFIGMAAADPNKGREALEVLAHAIEKLGLIGLTVDPYWHRRPADDRLYYPLYEYCASLRLPVAITTGSGAYVPETLVSDSHPDRIDVVARDFPQLPIIISHGGWPNIMQGIAVSLRHRNVYLDLVAYEDAPGSHLYADAVGRGWLRDRILFGSGNPFIPVEEAYSKFTAMNFPADSLDALVYGNAASLFGFPRDAVSATVPQTRLPAAG
jgi:uncharacterized protein